MITGKEDLLQTLIEAFIMEKGTQLFYSEAAAKVVHPDIKKTFQELSEWEKKHMDYIQFLYQSVSGDMDYDSFEDFSGRTDTPVTESGIPIRELEEKFEKYVFTNEKEALNLALKMEGKAYNLYNNMAEKAADSNARVVFKEMVDQEVNHISYIKKMKDRLAGVKNI